MDRLWSIQLLKPFVLNWAPAGRLELHLRPSQQAAGAGRTFHRPAGRAAAQPPGPRRQQFFHRPRRICEALISGAYHRPALAASQIGALRCWSPFVAGARRPAHAPRTSSSSWMPCRRCAAPIASLFSCFCGASAAVCGVAAAVVLALRTAVAAQRSAPQGPSQTPGVSSRHHIVVAAFV